MSSREVRSVIDRLASTVAGNKMVASRVADEIIRNALQLSEVVAVLKATPVKMGGSVVRTVLAHPTLEELEFPAGIAVRIRSRSAVTVEGESDYLDAYFIVLERSRELLTHRAFAKYARDNSIKDMAKELLVPLVQYMGRSRGITASALKLYDASSKGDADRARRALEELYSNLPTRVSWSYQLATSKVLSFVDKEGSGYVVEEPIKFVIAQPKPGGSVPQMQSLDARYAVYALGLHPKNSLTRKALKLDEIEVADDLVKVILTQMFS